MLIKENKDLNYTRKLIGIVQYLLLNIGMSWIGYLKIKSFGVAIIL